MHLMDGKEIEAWITTISHRQVTSVLNAATKIQRFSQLPNHDTFFFSPSKLEGNNGTSAGICCSDSEVSRPSSQVARSIRNWVPDIYVMCSSNQHLDNLGYSSMTLNVHRVCHLPNTKTSQGVWHWMTGSDLSLLHRWGEQLHSLKMKMLCMSTYTQHIGKWCHCLLNIMIDCSVLNILQQLKAVQLKIPH
jgi:hypothetical protein